MYNPDKAMVMFDQLSAAGKHGTLSLKILLHTYIEEREPLISETAKALKVSAPAISARARAKRRQARGPNFNHPQGNGIP